MLIFCESESTIALEKIKEFMDKYEIEDKPAIAKITQYFYEKNVIFTISVFISDNFKSLNQGDNILYKHSYPR